ncbi:hypothetical protein EZS27_014190 [termite gut metagenome]|uniref:Uncharacterized protein n=1 Tax=termite gut metagenome TaxID=433724 RepID=A0A5J4RXI0_9ZZZZ
MSMSSEIEEIEKQYNFYRTLANFHQKMVCNELFAEHSDFHLKKMKECDDICQQIGEQITQLCQKINKKNGNKKN